MIRNIHFVQPMQGSCQHWCTPFFWTPLGELPGKNALFRSRAFSAGRIPATPVNADCAESSGGRGRFAKRRTTGPGRNGHNCLNAATVLSAAFGRAVVAASTFRRMGRAQRTHHSLRQQLMGIAALHPSYKSGTLEERGHEPVNSDCRLDFVLDGHFGLNPDIAPCSFRVPRAERFPLESRMRH